MFNTKDALDITMYPNPKNELKENSSYLEKGFFFGGCNLFWTIMSLVPGTRPVWRKKARSGSWLSKVSVVWTRLVIYRLLGAEMTPLCAMETSACITRECLCLVQYCELKTCIFGTIFSCRRASCVDVTKHTTCELRFSDVCKFKSRLF